VYSELSALVTAQARRSSLASPWNSLDRVEMMQIHCPYYYLIPAALPDTESSDVDRFGTAHEEIFRSMAPYDPDGKQILGVFFRLRPAAAETK
jgi:hypothetical protein